MGFAVSRPQRPMSSATESANDFGGKIPRQTRKSRHLGTLLMWGGTEVIHPSGSESNDQVNDNVSGLDGFDGGTGGGLWNPTIRPVFPAGRALGGSDRGPDRRNAGRRRGATQAPASGRGRRCPVPPVEGNARVVRVAVRVVIITQIRSVVGIIVARSTEFDTRLSDLRAWLILLARLHLDYRFREREASDIAQETIVDAIKYRERIESLKSADLELWLRRVLRNKVVDFYRRQRPQITEADLLRIEADIGDSFLRLETMVVDCESSPSAQAVKHEDQLRLAEAIEQLPDPNREVIVLKDLAGWSLKQIADAQGCSIGTVAGRLRRGRDQLVQIIRGHHDPTTSRG